MVQTRIEESKAYRQRKRDELGNEAYKIDQARKKRENGASKRVATPEPEPEQPAEPEPDHMLETIYAAKLAIAETAGHTIKRASVESALNRIKRLHKMIYDEDMIDFEWTKHTNKVSKFILKSKIWQTDESRIQQFQSLASITKVASDDATYKFYSSASVSMRKDKDVVDDENKLTEKERTNIIPWAEIIKPSDELTDSEAALVACYTLFPPRRVKDFGLMKLTTTDEGIDDAYNYLCENPPKLIFMNYKTSSTFGRQEFALPAKLATKLKAHTATLSAGDFLFGKSKTAPYVSFSSQVSKVFKKHTGKPLSVNLLRHSYITHYLNTKRSLASRKLVAKKMGHGLAQQLKYDRLDL